MKNILFILAVLVIGISSCTEDLKTDFKGKSEHLLMVEGYITTDTTAHKVILSRTFDFSDTAMIYERGAIVTISDSLNVYPLTEYEPGIYLTDSNVFGEIGHTYILNITLSDGTQHEAVSHLNAVSTIDSIRFAKEYFEFTDSYYYKAYFYGQEPPGKGQFYIWNLYLNDSLFNDTINETRFEEDEWVDGNYLEDFDVYWVEEESVRGDTIEVMLEMESIPEEYNDFLIELMMETTWRGSPWDPFPANISTNISGEAVGFFVAKAVTRAKVTYYKSIEEKE